MPWFLGGARGKKAGGPLLSPRTDFMKRQRLQSRFPKMSGKVLSGSRTNRSIPKNEGSRIRGKTGMKGSATLTWNLSAWGRRRFPPFFPMGRPVPQETGRRLVQGRPVRSPAVDAPYRLSGDTTGVVDGTVSGVSPPEEGCPRLGGRGAPLPIDYIRSENLPFPFPSDILS